jgi:hypothetical protein
MVPDGACAAFGKISARDCCRASLSSHGLHLTFRGERHESRGQHMLEVRMDRPCWSRRRAPALPGPCGGGVRKPAIANWGEFPAHRGGRGRAGPNEPVWLEQAERSWATWARSPVPARVGKELTVFADIQVRTGGRSLSVAPAVLSGASGSRPRDAVVEGVGAVSLARVDADRRRVSVTLPASAAPRAIALVDLSTRPWISLVWIGAVRALLGSIVAGVRRAAETTPASRRGGRRRARRGSPT